MSRDRITPSEVILVMNGGPPSNPDLEAAAIGRRKHQEIEKLAKDGNPPALLRRIGVSPQSVGRDVNAAQRDIGDGLVLSAISDLRAGSGVIEIKPGADVKDMYLLQLGLTCVASRKPKGAVYLYGSEKLVVVDGGIEEAEESLINMARNARSILDTQEELSNHPSIKGAAKQAMGARSVRQRQEMDDQCKIFLASIKPRIKTYS